jgi:hypothetical protein
MNTERGEFRFTVKDNEGDEQWIVFEPVGSRLKSIKGLLGFQLKAGANAKAVAQFLNAHIRAPQYGEAGFAQNALYLIRPDSYVALADQSGSADILQRYFAQRGIRIEQAGGARQDAAQRG